jgi:hypothetical protein
MFFSYIRLLSPVLRKNGIIIPEKRITEGWIYEWLKRAFNSDFSNGKTANTTQKTKNNKIIDGLGLIRCLRNMVFYKNS